MRPRERRSQLAKPEYLQSSDDRRSSHGPVRCCAPSWRRGRKSLLRRCWQALADRAHPAMSRRIIHPFEDGAFIAGDASAGLEILGYLPDVDLRRGRLRRWGFAGADRRRRKSPRTQSESLCRRAGDGCPTLSFARPPDQPEFSRLDSELCRWLRRQVHYPRMSNLTRHPSPAPSLLRSKSPRRHAVVAERNGAISEGAGACAVAAGLSGKYGSGRMCLS